MNESKISVRYAKALFLSASEKGIVDLVRNDMAYLLQLSAIDQVSELLDSPVLVNSSKKKVFAALLKGKLQEITFNLVMLAIANNRESFLAGISRCYIDMADRFNGITKARLTTATGVNDATLGRIEKLIMESTGNNVRMEQFTDPEITGGFILKVEDNFIDGSVRTQLRKIEKELTQE